MQNELDKKRLKYLIVSSLFVIFIACVLAVALGVKSYKDSEESIERVEDIAIIGDNDNQVHHNGFVGEDISPNINPDGSNVITHTSDDTNIVGSSPMQDGSGSDNLTEITKEPIPKIDFDALLSLNKDCIGWLYIPSVELSYPIVRSSNNQDYVNTNFEGGKSISGTLFTDCRCSTPFYQKTIIYGHNMKNGSMFAKLYDLESLLVDNPMVYVILTNGECLEYQVESTKYTVNTDEEVYSVNPVDDSDTLILSTCVKNAKRFVVTAKKLSE